jgi:hypothetical protein
MSLSPRSHREYQEDGNNLYQHMFEQFYNKSIDVNQPMKYFSIREFPNDAYQYVDEVAEEHTEAIQPDTLQWILRERESGRLFDRSNWKLFPGYWDTMQPYLGYRFLFSYQEYYFHLTIEYYYNCTHEPGDETALHFQLALYGWTEESLPCIQPVNKYRLPSDHSVPEWDKYGYTLEDE